MLNKLGSSLSTSAKENLSNGQHLEASSATMTESVNNLADKANQQAASLEETAAAVEEITSITRKQCKQCSKNVNTWWKSAKCSFRWYDLSKPNIKSNGIV